MASPRNRHERALENFQLSLGGRNGLLGLLARSADPDGQRLLGYLSDPQFEHNSIRSAFRELGLNIMDLTFDGDRSPPPAPQSTRRDCPGSP